MNNDTPWLADLFLASMGKPVCVDGKKIIQMDRIEISSRTLIRLRFLGERAFHGNAAVIAVRKPDRILLSDGSPATAVAIWDEPGLPREVTHIVETERRCLEIYNKYHITFSDGFVINESFTGNAGMHVVEVAENVRRYECSNGAGPISLNDLVFELCWESLEAEAGR